MTDLYSILKTIRPEIDFAGSDDFVADRLLDSFDIVTLVSTIEKNYSVTIPGTEIIPENFKNLRAIEAMLKRIGAQP